MYRFLTDKHESRFKELCATNNTHNQDLERLSIFYVIAGSESLYENVELIYDFEENAIRLEVFNEPFLTGGSRSLIDLAFNLYNSASAECSVYDLFRVLDEQNSILALNAIKLRFKIPV